MATARAQRSRSVYIVVLAVAIGWLATVTPTFAVTALPSAEAKRLALDYLRASAGTFGLTADDIADVVIGDIYSSDHTGVTHVYLRQRYRGVEVADAQVTVNVTADGRIIQLGHRFLSNLASRVEHDAPSLTAADAEAVVASDAGPSTTVSAHDLPAMLVYRPAGDGRLRLAWDVVVDAQAAGGFSGNVAVDARSGVVLERTSWVGELIPAGAAPAPAGPAQEQASPDRPSILSPDSYEVFAIPKRSPDDGPRTVEAAPSLAGGLASPFGWHDTTGVAGAEYTVTQGNN